MTKSAHCVLASLEGGVWVWEWMVVSGLVA